ncbi:MAG TPA: L,D-transpeptidase [Candidatus Dormibacteraeota bacterium]|nr:L,D-transpeptidase [Candidatus Dormibacteraeota bacterium]
MSLSGRSGVLKIVGPLIAVSILLGGVGLALWNNSEGARAAAAYHDQRRALELQLKAAGAQGYTGQDLEPITQQLKASDATREPWWIPDQPGHFERLTEQVGRLRVELDSLEKQLLTQARADAAKQIDGAKSEITQAQQANADDSDVQSLQQRLGAAVAAQGAAHGVHDYRVVTQQATALVADATNVFNQATQENQLVQQLGQQLAARSNGNLGAIQQAGNQALGNARNDASIAAYMNKPSPFKGYDGIQRAYRRLEKYAGLIGNADLNQAALGAAAAQRYAGQIHDALMAGFPSKVVVVSFQAQHLWAYENTHVVLETPVTTGIRGVTDYGTDFGPMKVLYKEHPHTMHSPWPKTSPLWYPDAVVQWTTFFTWTGESIHDASWEPDSLLGPGSQYNASTRSHGCVHVPFADAQTMYNWAPVGMPVIVYPGDGSPLANQLAQITTDDQGTPKSTA